MRLTVTEWFLVAALVIMAVVGIQRARLDAHCLSLGWTQSKMDWAFNGYCVARTDQTDVVVPWREAKRR